MNPQSDVKTIQNAQGALIGLCPVTPSPRDSKRQAEHTAVQRILDLLAPGATLCHHPDGAPYLQGSDICISISHSSTTAAVALSNTPIGIDIEHRRPQLQRVKEKFLSPQELDWFTTPDMLLRAWCAKEAIYKLARIPGLQLINGIHLRPDLSEATYGPENTPVALSFTPLPDNQILAVATGSYIVEPALI